MGSGKGRIELVDSKYVFDYESQIDKTQNRFDLTMAFPIIGEKKISLSLNPKIAAKDINHSELLNILEEKIGNRYNKEEIINSIEEFFVLTSDFLYYKTKDQFPDSYKSHMENEHFFMERPHAQFRFEVESFALENGFYRRVLVKIFSLKTPTAPPLFSLFLVPESCEP